MGGLAGAEGKRFWIGDTIDRGPGVGRGRGCEWVMFSAALSEASGRFIGLDTVGVELVGPSISACFAALCPPKLNRLCSAIKPKLPSVDFCTTHHYYSLRLVAIWNLWGREKKVFNAFWRFLATVWCVLTFAF